VRAETRFATEIEPQGGRAGAATVRRALGLAALALAAVIATLLSLRVGSVPIRTADALGAVFDYDPRSSAEAIVRTLRLPRTLIGIGVGAALAISGAIMQAATRNALAGPSILGVSSGAAFAVVTAVHFLGVATPSGTVWYAFAGGLGASAIVFAIGAAGSSGASPVNLTLAGVIVSALLASWTAALLLLDEQTLDVVRFWAAGSLAGRDIGVFLAVLPFLSVGIIGGLLVSHQLNVLGLGEAQARALGMPTGLVRGACAGLVVLMTGAAVSAAGPIGFVGLAVPHLARALAGSDYRWVVPYSALLGIVLLLGADILGRVVIRPSELQVGIITAAVGAPFLVFIARRQKVADP